MSGVLIHKIFICEVVYSCLLNTLNVLSETKQKKCNWENVLTYFSTNKTQNSVFTSEAKLVMRYMIPGVAKPYTIISANIFHGVNIETRAIII